MSKFLEKGIQPFGVNPASAEKHLDYVNLKQFPFPLLSDPGREVASAYGAVKLMGKSINRSVFVVDRTGKLVFAKEGMPSDEEILESVS